MPFFVIYWSESQSETLFSVKKSFTSKRGDRSSCLFAAFCTYFGKKRSRSSHFASILHQFAQGFAQGSSTVHFA